MHTCIRAMRTISLLNSHFSFASRGCSPASRDFIVFSVRTHLCRLGEVFSSRTRTRCQTRSTACPRKIHGRHNSTNRLRNITFQTSLARLKRDYILIQLLSSCLRLFLPTFAPHSSFCCFLLPSSHHRPNTSAPAESTARFPPMKVCALPSARAFRQETSSCPP